jgi:hypothetical protein
MSSSLRNSMSGTVARDSDMRRTTVCWIRVGWRRVVWPLAEPGSANSSAPAAGASLDGAGAAVSATAWPLVTPAAPAPAARSTSRRITRPWGPDPLSTARSTFSSAATRRASGEALTRPPDDAGGACSVADDTGGASGSATAAASASGELR